MKVEHLAPKGTWLDVSRASRNTVRKEPTTKEPSASYQRRLLLAEHSPIRKLIFQWVWRDLKRWISDHFIRHSVGIEHWVTTQREDRTGISRDDLPQSAPVDHEVEVNAQAVINISRRRLCRLAHKETRQAWQTALLTLPPVVQSVCVPDCVYRGHCFELNPCGYSKTTEYMDERREYVG